MAEIAAFRQGDNALTLGGTAVTATATELNALAGGAGVAAVARIDFNSETKTLSSNAVTMTTGVFAAVITTEALTTAHTASQALVITCPGVATGDLAMVSKVGGTSVAGIPIFSAVCTTNTVTVTILNAAKATDAFNGTFIFNLIVFKA